MNKYHYVAENDPEGFKLGYSFERKGREIDFDDEFDLSGLAEDIADDYHTNHDGWESHWPCDFTIWTEQGIFIGVFTVGREYDPYFSASRIEK